MIGGSTISVWEVVALVEFEHPTRVNMKNRTINVRFKNTSYSIIFLKN